jgi:hypothetical protein
MTKLRTPDSIEDACKQAAALLGNEAISTALNAINLKASTSLIDKWGDMDAVQTPSLAQALAMESLLIKTGHDKIFGALFDRLLPQPPKPEETPCDPLREAMRATGCAVDLMEQVDRSMIDGRIDRAELNAIEKITHRAQQQIAKVRRVVRAALGVAPIRGRS